MNFLDHPAKTATAIAELSLKLSIPIIPIHERMKGAQFKYVTEPIYNLKKDYNHNDELNLLLEKINKIIGKWILKNPFTMVMDT